MWINFIHTNIIVRELVGEEGWHSKQTSAQCHKRPDFNPEDSKI